MKHSAVIVIVIIALAMAGCSITSPLARKNSRAIAAYKTNATVKEELKQSGTEPYELKKDSAAYYIVPTVTDSEGEQIISMNIEEIVVIAKSRTLPERDGKILVDFVITLPKELQGSCRSITVIPNLHKQDSTVSLEEVSIRGGLFSKVQDRNYWQFNQYVRVFRPDAVGEQRAFERFVKYPYPEGVRLDSIIDGRETISYYYTQEVPTQGEGKKMLITLCGSVEGLDGSSYNLPPRDTLEYNISSMLSFTDTTKRYVTRIIEKYAVVNERNYLTFKVNDTNIIDNLGNNCNQLERIEELMDRLINQNEFYIDSITLTASASPEGTFSRNGRLAKGRASSLKKRLVEKFGQSIDTLISVSWVAEAWSELAGLISDNEELKNKAALLNVINTVQDPDRREMTLRNKYPDAYRYIKEHLYPELRTVSFKYNLRRVGMIQDTIYTTEPDTLYSRGMELLNTRNYSEALEILRPYNDRNTAIALMSLGNDEQALEVLSGLDYLSATNCYLSAILCSRLGMYERGRELFIKACNLNENLEYRGKLDPEINKLIKIE